MPSVHVLQTIQWMTARHERGEQIDVVMDSEEEGEEPSAEGRCVLRKNGAKYKPYSAVSIVILAVWCDLDPVASVVKLRRHCPFEF